MVCSHFLPGAIDLAARVLLGTPERHVFKEVRHAHLIDDLVPRAGAHPKNDSCGLHTGDRLSDELQTVRQEVRVKRAVLSA